MSQLDRLFIRALGGPQSEGDERCEAATTTATTAVPTELCATSSARPTRLDQVGLTAPTTPAVTLEPAVSTSSTTTPVKTAPSELYVWTRDERVQHTQLQQERRTRELLIASVGTAPAHAEQATSTEHEGTAMKASRDSKSSGPGPAQPNWEVDSYTWPPICRRLESQLDECLHKLARIVLSASETGGHTVGVTSVRRREGRSSLLLALARQLAWLTGNLAVLDADWQHPELAKLLQVDLDAGWEAVLQGRLRWPEVALRSLREQMVVLPWCGEKGPEPRHHVRLRQLVDELTQRYRVLLVDMGPLGRSVGDHVPCDRVLFVRDCQHTTPEELQEAVAKLEFAGIQVLGVVENFAESVATPLRRAA